MKIGIRPIIFLGLILSFNNVVVAQKIQQIEIVKAGSLEGIRKDGVEVRRLVNDVVFKQEDTYLYCDSALFYESSNSIDAYGVVRIEGPRAKISGDVLHYEGNSKKALICLVAHLVGYK